MNYLERVTYVHFPFLFLVTQLVKQLVKKWPATRRYEPREGVPSRNGRTSTTSCLRRRPEEQVT